jgi:hypothetical protein
MRQKKVLTCDGIWYESTRRNYWANLSVVINDDVFDSIFGDTVSVNSEGALVTAADSSSVTDGLPFTKETVRRLLTREPMASPGACILDRAWKFRPELLGARS